VHLYIFDDSDAITLIVLLVMLIYLLVLVLFDFFTFLVFLGGFVPQLQKQGAQRANARVEGARNASHTIC
jgi:type IV secretory pathway TrbL component